jgi:hypothetical protein
MDLLPALAAQATQAVQVMKAGTLAALPALAAQATQAVQVMKAGTLAAQAEQPRDKARHRLPVTPVS